METDARRGRAAARRLLDGRAVRVTGEDLLPREDEIAPCARTSYGIQLAPDEASALHRATAGWAIALRLALRLRDLASALPPGDDAVFTPEARADLFAYLAAEVLSRIDPRLARFLRPGGAARGAPGGRAPSRRRAAGRRRSRTSPQRATPMRRSPSSTATEASCARTDAPARSSSW